MSTSKNICAKRFFVNENWVGITESTLGEDKRIGV